jgi:FkbM family methyltransferase
MDKNSFHPDHFIKVNGKDLSFQLSDMLVGHYLFEQVILKKEYLPEEIIFSEIENIVDIGANVGLFSCLMARLFPKSRIFSFEPAESNILKLKQHLSFNEINNIIIIPLALGVANEVRELFLPHDEGAYSLFKSNASLYTRGNGFTGGSCKVEVRNALEAILELGIMKIDFLKIDCEGAELEILSTIKPLLGSVKRVAIEWHPNVNVKELEIILAEHHFNFFRKYERFKNNDPSLSMGTLFGSKA